MTHLLALSFLLGSGFHAPQAPSKALLAGRKLVFSQDFSKLKKIDPAVWKFDDGPVYNNEKEKYVSGPGPNAYIKDGSLVLEATKVGNQYLSTRLLSNKSWKYGYFEAVLKVPAGRGTWPAFWMLNDRLRQTGPTQVGWPRCGEIDIMENVGYDPAAMHFSLHSQNFNFMRKEQRTSVSRVANPNEFHRFGLDWKPASITFYFDGKPMYKVEPQDKSFDSWPYVDKFYIILNLAIGGAWGGAKGIDDSIFPTRYEIKSVKIWQ